MQSLGSIPTTDLPRRQPSLCQRLQRALHPCLLLAAAWLPLRGMAAVSELLHEPDGIGAFELQGARIHWWDGGGACGGEFPHVASLYFRNSVLPNYAAYSFAKGCGILGNNGNPVRDDT